MGGLRKLRRKGAEAYRVEPLHSSGDRSGGKLSAAILDFAQPLLDRFPDDGDFEPAVSVAILCWNLALFPEEEGRELRRSLLREVAKGPPDFAQEIETWIEVLVERKRRFYAEDRRMVMNYTIVDEGDSRHLYVVSTPVPW